MDELDTKRAIDAVAEKTVEAVSRNYDLTDERNFEEFTRDLAERGRHDAVAANLPPSEIETAALAAINLGISRRAIARSGKQPWSMPADDSAARQRDVDRSEKHGRRVNVNFSEQAYQTLEALARLTGRSMSDVLRDAIALKSWFERTRAEGGHILVELPDGKVREVISV